MSPSVLPDIRCDDEDVRRKEIEETDDVQAIDYLEVTGGQLVLEVHFIPKATPAGETALQTLLDDLAANPTIIRVTGGERVRSIRVGQPARNGDVLVVPVDRYGDFSTYRLTLQDPRIDPAYTAVDFSFKAGCPSRFDCSGNCGCEDVAPPEPQIDYLAKDYRSFRQALLDRLPSTVPDWVERHEADLGIVLLELLAYAGDQLSYQQDAVANEAYLDSARQRVSVRRHARLVDYVVDEGASARAFVVATVSAPCILPNSSQLLTRRELPFGDTVPPLGPVLLPTKPEQREQALEDADAVFESRGRTHLHQSLNAIPIYTWDLADCCLPVGTTTVDLAGDFTWHPIGPGNPVDWGLKTGSLLVLEETIGVDTGLPADRDPTHRQVVRIRKVETANDPLHPGQAITRITWLDGDALPFPLCLSRRDEENDVQTVAVARGNVIVADHGESRSEWWPAAPSWTYSQPPAIPPTGLARGDRATRFLLQQGPLSMWRELGDGAVADMNDAGPKAEITLTVATSKTAKLPYTQATPDLIGARPFDKVFVVEVTNDGRASIRFGDDTNGQAPVTGAFVEARYRVGMGRQGNVGAETLRHALLHASLPITELRNPLPATGGRDAETISQIKVKAPVAFRTPQMRAVTEADYAEVATRVAGVAGAVARFRWTGSWLTVFLIIDAHDRDELDQGLADTIKAYVQRFTQTGYDLEVRPATYVPLDLELFACVARDRFRTDVEQALRRALSSRRLPDGSLGFFHPDRFGFGQPLYLSALYAAATAVPGVESVTARRFSGYYDDDPLPSRPLTAANVDAGLITVGDTEVIELLGDLSLPERGVLDVTTGGGR